MFKEFSLSIYFSDFRFSVFFDLFQQFLLRDLYLFQQFMVIYISIDHYLFQILSHMEPERKTDGEEKLEL